MSSFLENINFNYFKPAEPVSNPTDELEKSGEFVMIEVVQQVAQVCIQTLKKSQESRQTPLQNRAQLPEEGSDLDLSTSTPGTDKSTTSTPASSQVLQDLNTSASTSSLLPSGKAAILPHKPYIFERTSVWRTMQLGNDPTLRIEGPDLEGDILVKHGDLSKSFNTSDKGIYKIQVHSDRIDVQFISALDL